MSLHLRITEAVRKRLPEAARDTQSRALVRRNSPQARKPVCRRTSRQQFYVA
jgi:hypothetical protein